MSSSIKKTTPLEKSRLAWKSLTVTGAAILVLTSLSSWASVNFHFLIYLLVVMAFIDLGLLGVFSLQYITSFPHDTADTQARAQVKWSG